MNAVGIDVSKGKSMVAILRPYSEIVASPFEVKHTTSNLNLLVELIRSVDGESCIVMEHTGRYYEPIVHRLSRKEFCFHDTIQSAFCGRYFCRVSK